MRLLAAGLLIGTLAGTRDCHALISDGTADVVLGQSTTTITNSDITAAGMQQPADVAFDPGSSRVYVADFTNSRVLWWNDRTTLVSGQPADGVLCRSSLGVGGAAPVAASATTCYNPSDVAVDASGNVWVVIYGQNRVLRFPKPTTAGTTTADLVLGQADFTSSSADFTQNTLSGPWGVKLDSSGNVWVTEYSNNRVIRFSPPFSNGMNADLVLGQADFTSPFANRGGSAAANTLNQPYKAEFDAAGNLWVADCSNNRALRYSVPFSSGMAATVVLGQADFTSGSANRATTPAANGQNCPADVEVDASGNVWITDYSNNRILRYSTPFTDGEDADLVLGQADFSLIGANRGGDPAANTLKSTEGGLEIDPSGKLWVADYANNRVLRYTPPFTNGMDATLVLGQSLFTLTGANQSLVQLKGPRGVLVTSAGRLYVTDTYGHRVVYWDDAAMAATGAPADGIYGQDDYSETTSNRGMAIESNTLYLPANADVDNSGKLWIADRSNNRVLRVNSQMDNADLTLGQADTTSGQANRGGAVAANTLNEPQQVRFDASGNLWVSDTSNHRVLRYTPPFTNSMDADLVLGLADLTTSVGEILATSSSTLNTPNGLAFDASGNLWVADTNNHRAIRFPTPFSNGMSADLVLGQPDYTSTGISTSSSSLESPEGVFLDSSGNVWVADTQNSRVLKFSAPISSGMAASAVIGQADFFSEGSNPGGITASGFNTPSGVHVDSSGNLWVADLNNKRVMLFCALADCAAPSAGGGTPDSSTETITSDGGTITYSPPQGTVTVTVPPGTFSGSVSVTVGAPTSIPASNNSAAGSLTGAGFGIEITASGGVQPSKPITLVLNYRDSDVVGLDEAKLVLARYDTARSVWVPLATTVDAANNKLTATIDHFSTFQVMALTPAATVSAAKAYPNPFRPAKGHTSVTFSNLPASTSLKIHTLTGELVRELTTSGAGLASWDGKNASGNNAASGVYFVFASAPSGGGEKTFKIAVQR